jgi:organic hydroperoxide reductase OsmC/OhrA
MSEKSHLYEASLTWTGAAGGPTESYRSYSREFRIEFAGKPALIGSADPLFRGDPTLLNPEDMLVGALASCHMLSYLFAATQARVVVTAYEDRVSGMMEFAEGTGRFTEVVLRPMVTVGPGTDLAVARQLHERAHAVCFIANSVNFPVRHEATIVEAARAETV